MMIFGFIAGATNENTSIALIAMVLAFMVYYKTHGIKVVPWMFSGLAGNILGCLFMLVSPGELIRMDGMGGINSMKILKNTVRITFDIADYFSVLILIFTLIFSLYIYVRQDIPITRKSIYNEIDDFFITMIYILGFISSVYSMILSPSFPDRVWSGPLVLLLIVLLSFYTDIFSKLGKGSWDWICPILYSIFFMISISVYGKGLYELIKINDQYEVRMEIIQNTIETGQREVHLPSIKSDSKYSCFESSGDLGWDANDWPNTDLAKYYGIQKIYRDDSIVLEEKK